MKGLLLLLSLFVIVASSIPANASLIRVMDINFSSDTIYRGNDIRLDDNSKYSLYMGGEMYAFITYSTFTKDLGIVLPITFTNTVDDDLLTPQLTRTYVLRNDPGWYSEPEHWYSLGIFKECVVFWGYSDPPYGNYRSSEPIVDLSGYDIDGYYLRNSAFDDGVKTDYRIEVFADATPVPEPSTIMTCLAGLSGVGFLLRRKRFKL